MFMTLARVWQQIEKEYSHLLARQNIYNKITYFKQSYSSTIPSNALEDVQEATGTQGMHQLYTWSHALRQIRYLC